MEFYGENKTTSAYNLSISQILELRNLFNDCNRFSVAGELQKWHWKLQVIRRELAYDAFKLDKNKKDETQKYNFKLDEADKEVNRVWKNKTLLYKALDKKETLLRFLLDECGKGTKRVYDDEDDFDE